MEEKDVTFNLVTNKNGEVYITSDIDDCPDYLSIQEKALIASRLYASSMMDIINNIIQSNDVEEDEYIDRIAEGLNSFSLDMVKVILNGAHNCIRQCENLPPENIECSIHTYSVYQKVGNKNLYGPEQTLHSDDLNILDPLQAGYSFILDVLENMLQFEQKPKVKELLIESITAILKDCLDFIDEYEIEQE